MHRKSKLNAENLGGAKVHSRISSCARFSAETEPEVLNQERKLLSYLSQDKMEKPPSYYAKKLYYVTLVYDPRNLQFMLGKFGADHIIMGTDYPFLLWEAPPGKIVEMLENVSVVEKKQMLGENAI